MATLAIQSAPSIALRVETLASGLDTPWDLAWGPDGAIWVTERPGTISRVDPATGRVTRIGQIEVAEVSESGLMGMAFHPDFASQPYVYLAHWYSAGGEIRNRLVRMRYDGTSLDAPAMLLGDIPGNRNHDGSRLAVGPDRLPYMTTGDAVGGLAVVDGEPHFSARDPKEAYGRLVDRLVLAVTRDLRPTWRRQ